MPFFSSSELCSRIKALYRKTWYLNNPFPRFKAKRCTEFAVTHFTVCEIQGARGLAGFVSSSFKWSLIMIPSKSYQIHGCAGYVNRG